MSIYKQSQYTGPEFVKLQNRMEACAAIMLACNLKCINANIACNYEQRGRSVSWETQDE